MRKVLTLILVAFFWSAIAQSGSLQQENLNLLSLYAAAGGGGATNYLTDGNCQGAWYMNGGLSLNGDDETDRCSGGSTTLTETTGDIPNSSDVPSGYSGNSRDFEFGDSEYLTEADSGTTDINGADQALSISAWVKNESITTNENQPIVAKYEAATNQRQYAMNLRGTGSNTYKIQVLLSADGTNYTQLDSTTTNYASGAWHHVAMVYNDTDIRIYVDGSLDCSPASHTTGIYNGSASFRIGNWEVGSNFFDGLIDDVIILDRELSAAEVAEIYGNGIDGAKGAND